MGESRKWIWVAVVCIVAFFVNNAVILPDIMESRNIVTAREMVYDGHWVVTTMNGELRLEKPPLPTWMAAVVEMVSPNDISAQRVVSGLGALLLVFYFCLFAKRILQTDILLPVLLLCTCYNVILMGRTATWDIWCHAFMMAGIYYLARGLQREGPAWREFVLMGIFTGLSIMSKGPVSLYALLLPFLISFALLARPSARDKAAPIVMAVVLALLIGGWWYAYIYAFHADDMARVAAKESGSWFNHNTRPWWYYWKFFLETGGWSLLLLTAIVQPLWNNQSVYRQRLTYLQPLLWMVVMLVLLSLLPEKKSRYLLPMLIPASLTMAALVNGWETCLRKGTARKADRVLIRLNGGLLALVVAALPVVAYAMLYRSGMVGLTALVFMAVVSWGIAAWLVVSCVRLRPKRMVYAIAVLFAVAECAVLPSLSGIINNPDRHSIAATREVDALKPLDFYYDASTELRIELVYATGKKIRPLDLTQPDSVLPKLPCAVMTLQRVGEVMPSELLEAMDTVYVDYYDDNSVGKGRKRYRPHLFNHHVTILKPRAEVAQTAEEGHQPDGE